MGSFLTNVMMLFVGWTKINKLKRRNMTTNKKNWRTFSTPLSRGSTKRLEVREVKVACLEGCLVVLKCPKEVHLDLVEPNLVPDQPLKKLINFVQHFDLFFYNLSSQPLVKYMKKQNCFYLPKKKKKKKKKTVFFYKKKKKKKKKK